MAFLFKSKKNLEKGPPQTKDGSNGVVGSQTALQNSNGRPSRDEKGANTPGSSVNNSLNSLGGGTTTPSPDQNNGRRGPSVDQVSDLPVSISMQNPDMRIPYSRHQHWTLVDACNCSRQYV